MTEFVKKQDVIDALNIISDKMDDEGQAVMQQAADIVKDVVPADVLKNVHGEWIPHKIKLPDRTIENYTCSVCGRKLVGYSTETLKDAPFCHCGADMRKKHRRISYEQLL